MRDTLPDPFDRLGPLVLTAIGVLCGVSLLISALFFWKPGLLMTGLILVAFGVPKFFSLWRGEPEFLIPAVLVRIVLPLGAIVVIAGSTGAWLLGVAFAALLIVSQAYYFYVLRPKQNREHGRKMRRWWR